MISDASIVRRWKAKLKVRQALLAAAQKRRSWWSKQYHKAKPGTKRRTYTYRRVKKEDETIKLRKQQVADAKKVIARHTPMAQHMSTRGLEMLIREEGSIPYAYNDPAGHATFGVGHLIHYGPVTAADQRKWGTRSHPKTSLVLPTLKKDIKKYESAVRKAVKVPLKQHEFDALVSLCFNIGTGGFSSSTVVHRLNAGDKRGAADAILMWDNPSMLRPRRERERRLFLTGRYS
jgi:GH24 family phage-related lysozyme (muramidase)